MTVTVPTDPAHRTAEEIGRTAAGPRRAARRSAPTREVPLPDVVDVTLPNGLRVLAAHRAGRPDGRAARCGCRSPAPSATPSTRRRRRAARRDPAHRHRDPRPRRDRRRAGRGRRRPRRRRRPRAAADRRLRARRGPARRARRARRRPHRRHAPRRRGARERDRLVERITVARAQPRTIAREALQRKRFGDHPITREMPTGPAVAAVTAEQVRALQARVAGAAAARSSRSSATSTRTPRSPTSSKHLGGWTADARGPRAAPPPPLVRGRPGAGAPARLGAVAAAAHRARAAGRDRPRYAALQLANLVFGGYFSSRWMENIREDKGYTYGAHSGIEFVPGGAVLGVETDVASDVTAAALLETRYELGRIVAVPPTAAEVDAARAYAIGSLLDLAGQPGRAGSTLAALAADGLALDWLRGHPARLEAVTVEEVAAAALRFFAPTAFTGVVVGDADVIGAAALRALGGVAVTFRPRPTPAGALPLAPCSATRRCAPTSPGRRRAGRRRGSSSSTTRAAPRSTWTDAPTAGFEVADAGSWDRGGTARLRTRPTDRRRPDRGRGAARRGRTAWRTGRCAASPTLVAGRRPGRLGRPAHGRRRRSTRWARACSSPRVAVLNWHDTARVLRAATARPTHAAAAGWHRHLRGGRARGVPAHRPGRDLPGARRRPATRPACCSPASPSGPIGRFTVLAGFVEAGESLEACVRREIHEEVGVHVRDVAYLGSQAWPFPRSLMVGVPGRRRPGRAARARPTARSPRRCGSPARSVREALRGGRLGRASEAPAAAPGQGEHRPQRCWRPGRRGVARLPAPRALTHTARWSHTLQRCVCEPPHGVCERVVHSVRESAPAGLSRSARSLADVPARLRARTARRGLLRRRGAPPAAMRRSQPRPARRLRAAGPPPDEPVRRTACAIRAARRAR